MGWVAPRLAPRDRRAQLLWHGDGSLRCVIVGHLHALAGGNHRAIACSRHHVLHCEALRAKQHHPHPDPQPFPEIGRPFVTDGLLGQNDAHLHQRGPGEIKQIGDPRGLQIGGVHCVIDVPKGIEIAEAYRLPVHKGILGQQLRQVTHKAPDVNISARRGVWGKPGFPIPPPAVGRAAPSQKEPVFIPSGCGAGA